MFAEQVGLGFFTEIGLDDAGLAATVGHGIAQGQVAGAARFVLVHRNQVGHAAALGVGAAHRVAGGLGRHHPHIQVGARIHQAVMHIKAVGEYQRRALLDIGLDIVGVHATDLLVRQQNHHDVRRAHGVGYFSDLQAGFFNFRPRGAAFTQAHHHLDAAVVQVLRVGVALAAIADDGNGFALDQAQVAVFVVINFHFLLRINKGGGRLVAKHLLVSGRNTLVSPSLSKRAEHAQSTRMENL